MQLLIQTTIKQKFAQKERKNSNKEKNSEYGSVCTDSSNDELEDEDDKGPQKRLNFKVDLLNNLPCVFEKQETPKRPKQEKNAFFDKMTKDKKLPRLKSPMMKADFYVHKSPDKKSKQKQQFSFIQNRNFPQKQFSILAGPKNIKSFRSTLKKKGENGIKAKHLKSLSPASTAGRTTLTPKQRCKGFEKITLQISRERSTKQKGPQHADRVYDYLSESNQSSL